MNKVQMTPGTGSVQHALTFTLTGVRCSSDPGVPVRRDDAAGVSVAGVGPVVVPWNVWTGRTRL